MLLIRHLLPKARHFSLFSPLFNLKNDAIGPPNQLLRLVSPETNALLPPRALRDILRTVPLSTHSLVLVAPANAQDGTLAVVKILPNEEQKLPHSRDARESRKKEKEGKEKAKEVALTWSADGHDVEYKLKRAKAWLEEGRKVEVSFTRKKGTQVTKEGMKALMQSVQSELEEIAKRTATGEEKEGDASHQGGDEGTHAECSE
ncbi:hypothetical protein BT69DRAFT_954785 [Atractiella rhizophila]|nr:hypothetical protein BT69DRAFT_954785 [Atractiella rhizophila]